MRRSMKNLLSAMGLFGLMVVFSGSAFAQKGIVIGVDGSGGLKPAAGQKIAAQVHYPTSDNPAVGVKKGTNVCLLAIRSGGQQATALMDIKCSAMKLMQDTATITKVENPKNVDIIKDDKVNLDLTGRTISVSRGNNPAPIIKIMY